MITTKLQGGMGNQMFQYAMGYAQSKRLGVGLQIDRGYLPYRNEHDAKRVYMLDMWAGIQEPVVRNIPVTVIERGRLYDQVLLDSIKDGDCLEGFWQTEKYFKEYRKDLLRAFLPAKMLDDKAVVTLDDIRAARSRSTFLTIRRGDYVGNKYHGEMTKDYYLEALKIISEKVNPRVFVFSDEPEWVKKNFDIPYEWSVAGSFDITTPSHNGREDSDLMLMSWCHNAVLANSSFSWWGAWLGRTQDRIVIGPKKWFATPNEDPRDIIPDEWIKI